MSFIANGFGNKNNHRHQLLYTLKMVDKKEQSDYHDKLIDLFFEQLKAVFTQPTCATTPMQSVSLHLNPLI
ncbi:MAG TPA: hypothetical protein PKM63_07190 [Panacibacter sp.]|nr:hypothetical protein [Panacibacter sp.]HNP44054.1 hypothetical protein [Panacibacter sp.]